MKRLLAFLQLMILVYALGNIYGATLKVPKKYPTIQAGIDAAGAGDTVTVAAGTYNEDIVLKSGVIVQGAGADTTTIQGTGSGPVVTAVDVDATATIDGFTITGGGNSFYSGGITCDSSSPTISNTIISNNSGYGISCMFDSTAQIISNKIIDNDGGIGCILSSPTILNNVIKNNSTEWGAGGIACGVASSPSITDNVIIDNTSIHGTGGIACDVGTTPVIMGNTIQGNSVILSGVGGISCYRAGPRIINNEINANLSLGRGGGIAVDVHSWPEISGNRIVGNLAQSGGGIGGWNASPATITNNIIINNESLEGGGIYGAYTSMLITNNVIVGNRASVGGGVYFYYAGSVTNSIVWGNGDDLYGYPSITSTYSCIEDGDAGEGNISLAPLFVDAANGDYRLQALSPCIDTGKNLAYLPATDLLGNTRIVDGDGDSIFIVDMGPYEYAPQIIVEIDIKPGSAVNPVNLRSNGMMTVALLTTDDFDAWTADITTILFGPNGASPVHISSDDVDGDGDLDVVFHFRQQDTGIGPDDTTATLRGRTTDSTQFAGDDIITMVAKHKIE
ncbi:hypothetical protein BVX99_00850 [bacterium F16]|nr:hypothetical protein BVX99_00850 [bacterium F16]